MSVNITANGNSAEVKWSGSVRNAIGNFSAKGTFDSGTLKLQHADVSGGTFVDVGADTTLTADGMGSFRLPSGVLRVNLAGVVTAADINFDITES